MTLRAFLLACSLLGLQVSTYSQAPEGPDTTESTTEDSTGLVTSVSPYSTITVEDRKGPFTYRLGLDLHVSGPDNRPLKITEVHAGDEVTVFYFYRSGHPTVSRLVVLRRSSISGK
ncbi:MAG: hypothetical protein INR62_00220 [Rhodospirillales bacterium]|nr:hypothetical protein [Acetobacter sp.]